MVIAHQKNFFNSQDEVLNVPQQMSEKKNNKNILWNFYEAVFPPSEIAECFMLYDLNVFRN